MAKFKNKKTGLVIEENLIFYVNRMKNNPNFEEIKEETKPKENKKTKEEEVETTPQK
jgi:hypothetical protein